MRLLGAILAGGASTRFGSDKALAPWAGQPLIAHAIAALRQQVDTLAVIGRDWPGLLRIDDRPATGLGPLGGLCGALHNAAANGFDAVLCVPCDTIGLPADLAARLAPGPAVALGQPTIGLWPAALAGALAAHLAAGERSLHGWVAAAGAGAIDLGPLLNINRPADLAAPAARRAEPAARAEH